MKPLESKCKMYCKDYPCNKMECARGIGWKADGIIYMMSESEFKYINSKMQLRRKKEPRVTFVNTVLR